jgi:hypothetical protein
MVVRYHLPPMEFFRKRKNLIIIGLAFTSLFLSFSAKAQTLIYQKDGQTLPGDLDVYDQIFQSPTSTTLNSITYGLYNETGGAISDNYTIQIYNWNGDYTTGTDGTLLENSTSTFINLAQNATGTATFYFSNTTNLIAGNYYDVSIPLNSQGNYVELLPLYSSTATDSAIWVAGGSYPLYNNESTNIAIYGGATTSPPPPPPSPVSFNYPTASSTINANFNAWSLNFNNLATSTTYQVIVSTSSQGDNLWAAYPNDWATIYTNASTGNLTNIGIPKNETLQNGNNYTYYAYLYSTVNNNPNSQNLPEIASTTINFSTTIPSNTYIFPPPYQINNATPTVAVGNQNFTNEITGLPDGSYTIKDYFSSNQNDLDNCIASLGLSCSLDVYSNSQTFNSTNYDAIVNIPMTNLNTVGTYWASSLIFDNNNNPIAISSDEPVFNIITASIQIVYPSNGLTTPPFNNFILKFQGADNQSQYYTTNLTYQIIGYGNPITTQRTLSGHDLQNGITFFANNALLLSGLAPQIYNAQATALLYDANNNLISSSTVNFYIDTTNNNYVSTSYSTSSQGFTTTTLININNQQLFPT